MRNQLIYGDNLKALRALAPESVDLIYLDPPYNSKRDYNCTFGSVAQSKAFTDTWTWGVDDERHLRELQNLAPSTCALLDALGRVLPKRGLYPYLVAMSVRLVEMHRVLKDTGSIYLHVDPTASHYLKLVMDQIFGGGNFRNEIVWCYSNSGRTTKAFASKHDIILAYGKTNKATWTDYRVAISEDYLNSHYRQTDSKGRRCRIRVDAGKERIYYPDAGMICNDWWDDIPSLNSVAHERLGYPTQKPLALLERIIKASSNEGDVVLDPYMGSGTTIEAAAAHGRKWIGIDVTHHAVATTVNRLKDCGLEITKEQIIGVPEDLASARKLKEDNTRQFDAWCVLQCDASPADVDDRIVGIRSFPSIAGGNEHKRRALYAATIGDPPTMTDIKNTLALMKSKGCEVGKLFCFEMPEDPQVLLAITNLPAYTDDMRRIPKLELITVRDLLAGCSAPNMTSEYRERRMRDLSRQMELV